MDTAELAERHRVRDAKNFDLATVDPSDTAGLDIAKGDAKDLLETHVKDLRKWQERLFAEGKRSLLIVLQAMDTAGKDSAIKHVLTGINPQGVDVTGFKAPSTIERSHDYLWRHVKALPSRGRIGIFNRSHYEEVLVVRVHPEILRSRGIATDDPDLWKHRFKSIREFERHMSRSGTTVLKFYLHISKEEQARRLLARIDEPDKNWKFAPADMKERAFFGDYMHAYEELIRHTSRDYAPWFVVPANDKWYSRLVISATICETLAHLDPRFPDLGETTHQEFADARAELVKELEEAKKSA